MNKLLVWLAIATCGISSVAMGQAPEPAETEPAPAAASEADIARLIQDLDAEAFAAREQATQRLVEIGGPAIPAVAKAVQGQSLEVTSRGIEILRKLYESPKSKDAAQAALAAVAKSENKSAARRAESILNPERAPAPGTPAVPENAPNFIPQVLPPGVRIQANAIGGGGRISIRNNNGQKTIDAEENGKKIKIEESPAGEIKMEVIETVDGKEKSSKYEAKSAAELKKNHPDAHKLYEQYSNGNAVVGQIRIGRIAGAIPALPGIPGIQGLQDNSKAKEQIGKARQELDKAMDAVKKLDPAKATPEDLKNLSEQLEAAAKRLESAEQALDPK